MAKKRRFGVSLNEEVFEELTHLSLAIGVDRSKIISMAAREFLSKELHFARAHECEGVLVVSYTSESRAQVDKLIEDSARIIVGRSHFHARNGCCVEVLYLRGSSEDTWNFRSSISGICRACHYIPTCM